MVRDQCITCFPVVTDLQEGVFHILDRYVFAAFLDLDVGQRYEQKTGDDETEQTFKADCL